MLKAQRKFNKKEVQQDDIIASFNRARSFYDLNKKYISYAVTALAVLIVGGYIYVRNHSANNEKAATELGKVFSIYDAAANDPTQYKIAIEGQPGRGIMGLKTITENYGGTKAGELARFYLANAYYNTGKVDEALKEFENFGGGDKMLKASATAGVAACYESKGKPSEAANYYEKASSIVSDVMVSPDYLTAATRCYAKAGDKEKALGCYQRLKREYPTSQGARDAERYVAPFAA